MSKTLATEHEVRSIKAPPATDTWHPFPHAVLLDELQGVADHLEVYPESTRYELSQDGSQFFGAWMFPQPPDGGSQPTIGFRSSINKTIAVGLTAGTHVVVCSNLCFSGEWLQFRKHTKNVMTDLHFFILEAFEVCIQTAQQSVVWQDKLDNFVLTSNQWKTITYDALAQGIVAPSKVEPLLTPMTYLGEWFNIVTNILSNRSLLYTAERFAALKGLMRQFIPEETYDRQQALL